MDKLQLTSLLRLQLKKELILVTFCAATIVVAALYFSKTGIDLFDEGYYLLGYDKHQDIFFQLTGFHFLVRALPFSDHLVMIRLYRILLLALAAYVLARSLHRYIYKAHTFTYVLAYTFLGNLLTYVYSPASLSYNTLSVIFIELLLAAYLAFRSTRLTWSRSVIVPVVLLGIILSLQAFNKPTSALLLSVLLCIDQFICRKATLRVYVLLLAGVGFVSLFCFSLLVYVCYGPQLPEILRLLQQPDNPFIEGYLYTGFLFDQLFINTLVKSKKLIVFTIGYLLLYLMLQRRRLYNTVLAVFLFSVLTIFVFYQSRAVYYGLPGAEYFYSFFLFFCILWLIHRQKLSYIAKPEVRISVFLILFVLPFIGFWGSDNPPMLGIIHYMGFSLLLVVYMNQLINFRFLPVMVVLITFFTLYNYTWAPYHNPPVFKQKKEISVRGVTIKVSDHVFSEVEKFKSVYTFIQQELPLIPVGVPNGLLYIHQLQAYYTICFNNPKFTAGYLRLLQEKGVLNNVQILVYKKESSSIVKRQLSLFFKLQQSHGLLPKVILETDDYRLYLLSKANY